MTISSWSYLVGGAVPPRLLSPMSKESYIADEADDEAAAVVPRVASCEASVACVMRPAWGLEVTAPVPAEAVAEVSASTKEDRRTICVVTSTSWCEKTHLVADAWYTHEKLDQPQYVNAVRAAGITDGAWSVTAQQAKKMSVYCVNSSGLTSCSGLDQETVTFSAWYKMLLLTNPRRKQSDQARQDGTAGGGADVAGTDRGGANGAAADMAVEDVGSASPVCADAAGTGRGCANRTGPDANASDVAGAVGKDVILYTDSRLLPLYLRVLWCLTHQASMPVDDFIF